jgi:lysozyme
MLVTPALIDLITRFEGFRPEIYKDEAGVDTIGYGHTRSAVMPIRITQEEGQELLRQDLGYFVDVVLDLVKVPVNQNQFAALVSFAYNLGEGNLRGSTLLRKLNEGDFAGASEEFMKWDNAGGRKLRGLTRRRAAEEQLFRTPAADQIELAVFQNVPELMTAMQGSDGELNPAFERASFFAVVPNVPLILKSEEVVDDGDTAADTEPLST